MKQRAFVTPAELLKWKRDNGRRRRIVACGFEGMLFVVHHVAA